MFPTPNTPGEAPEPSPHLATYYKLRRTATYRFQKFLDDSIPWLKARWGCTAAFLGLFFLRIYYIAGFYIVTYALGIYILNLLIGFLTPQIDPELELEGNAGLPTSRDDEYKPFIRRLPEFKFWYALTRACVIAMFCTFFSVFNIPVYWPILLVYFAALFFVTMKKQIKHMIKYKYIPINVGKPKYMK